MRKWYKWLLLAVLLVGLMTFISNRPPPPGDETSAETVEATPPETVEPDPDADEPTPQQPIVRGTTRPGSKERNSSEAMPSQTRLSYSLDEDTRIGEWLEQYQQSVRQAQPEDHDLMKQRAEDEEDGEAAFWLHEFYKFCDDVPRSDWQLESALARTERRVEYASSEHGAEWRLRRAQNALDWYEQGYELCAFLGPDFDTKYAALSWLETAANLGHMPALRLYHSQARELLTEDDSTLGFQQPELIRLFKSNARNYARQLLDTGHPQGYMLMARMYYMGDVYEQDYLTAYAYARAGSLVGTAGAQSDGQMWMRIIGVHLPPTEIPKADRLANEILSDNRTGSP